MVFDRIIIKGGRVYETEKKRILVTALLLSLLLMVATVGIAAEKPIFLGFAGGPSGVSWQGCRCDFSGPERQVGGNISPTTQGTSGGRNVALVGAGKVEMGIEQPRFT
jgi:hypothetical protein